MKVWERIDVPLSLPSVLTALDVELGILEEHLAHERPLASHIPGSYAIAVPVTRFSTPEELFANAEGSVSSVSYSVEEYPDYWLTIHPGAGVPINMLIDKRGLGSRGAVRELCERLSSILGCPVGGDSGMYLQVNSPGFQWKLHTDDEYEGVSSRIHVPLRTSRENELWWADANGVELDRVHLEPGGVFAIRTDVLHSASNKHAKEDRIHLIIDVHSPQK